MRLPHGAADGPLGGKAKCLPQSAGNVSGSPAGSRSSRKRHRSAQEDLERLGEGGERAWENSEREKETKKTKQNKTQSAVPCSMTKSRGGRVMFPASARSRGREGGSGWNSGKKRNTVSCGVVGGVVIYGPSRRARQLSHRGAAKPRTGQPRLQPPPPQEAPPRAGGFPRERIGGGGPGPRRVGRGRGPPLPRRRRLRGAMGGEGSAAGSRPPGPALARRSSAGSGGAGSRRPPRGGVRLRAVAAEPALRQQQARRGGSPLLQRQRRSGGSGAGSSPTRLASLRGKWGRAALRRRGPARRGAARRGAGGAGGSSAAGGRWEVPSAAGRGVARPGPARHSGAAR